LAAPVLDAKHTADMTVHQALADLEGRQLSEVTDLASKKPLRTPL
jgi:hypothetical protein